MHWLRSARLAGRIGQVTGLRGKIHDDLMAALAAEPCVLARDQMTAELREGSRKLRKGMAPR